MWRISAGATAGPRAGRRHGGRAGGRSRSAGASLAADQEHRAFSAVQEQVDHALAAEAAEPAAASRRQDGEVGLGLKLLELAAGGHRPRAARR